MYYMTKTDEELDKSDRSMSMNLRINSATTNNRSSVNCSEEVDLQKKVETLQTRVADLEKQLKKANANPDGGVMETDEESQSSKSSIEESSA
mmetsp:Transcript_26320/g.29304  ORF Transcript_26320/g.29304 Transcript_26320/m.29304 type:complete len:92 (+) Transcript_26320:2-277(+)